MSITTLLHRAPVARLRVAVRAGVVAAVTGAPLLAATVASAASNHTYDGEDSGPGLSVLQTIGIFVCIPIGLFLLIAFLVALPGWVRGDSNRREAGWVETAPAPAQADTAAPKTEGPDEAESVAAGKSAETGGASGSW